MRDGSSSTWTTCSSSLRISWSTSAIHGRYWENDLFVKPEKCVFWQNKVEYLGMIIEEDKIGMDPVKLRGITDWPLPKTVKDVQSFLGFGNYYCYECPSFYFFLFPFASQPSDSVITFSLSLCHPRTSLCLPFCLMASIFRYDSLWLILRVILIFRPSDFRWLILWVIPIFSLWLLWTMTHS